MSGHQISGPALWGWWQQVRQRANLLPSGGAAHPSQEPAGNDVNLAAELEWLLREVAGLDRLSLQLATFRESAAIVSTLTLAELNALWQRRRTEGIPIQYLLGIAPWRDLTLKVSPAVLIPRPETEDLIELAIAAVQQSPAKSDNQQITWADLGTGSGAIAIGLARAFPAASIYAVDCSAAALAIAAQNIRQLHLEERVHCYQGSWLQPLAFLKGRLKGIVANPPYIPTAMIKRLQPEVAHHEPHLALDGGSDGLESICTIIATAPHYLQPGGVLLLEMMAGQAESVQTLLQEQGRYRDIQIFCDLAGIQRFVRADIDP